MRTSIYIVLLALPVWGCFDPQIAVGLRCDETACPQGQFCAPLDPDGDGTFEEICQLEVGGDADGGIPKVVFAPAQQIPLGVEPFQIIAENINGDGFDDLIVSAGSIGVHVFLSQGNGSFEDPFGSLPSGSKSLGIAVGDLNLDGTKDIAYLFSDELGLQLAFALNHVSLFEPIAATLVSADPLASRKLTIAQLDADQLPDVLLWDFNTVGKAFVQDEPMTPFPTTSVDFELGVDLSQVLAGDINGDNRDDIIIVGGGGLGARLQQSLNPGSYDGAVGYLPDPASWAVLADVSGDQRGDIVVSTFNSMVTMIHSQANNVYEEPLHANGTGLAQTIFDLADIDGDGAMDLVTPSGTLFFGDPLSPGAFREGGRLQEAFFPNPLQVVFGNFGGDFKIDVAVLESGQGGGPGSLLIFVQQ